jgi:hypothetical protein
LLTTRAAALVLLVTFCATPVLAQDGTVSGVVIDDRTERPIKGVLVYIEGQQTLVETDVDGRFSMRAPLGPQTITASVIGYALLTTDIELTAAPIDMTIRLSEGAGAYKESVTVSGSLRGESDSVPGSTSLHGRELENLRGAVLDDPLRAIQALPSATATDDFYSEFAVRGNPFRQVGLVVDGVPSRYLMHAVNGITDGGSIAMINSDTLGSVSLLPGSYPQRTGRHLGAEVDLATRDGSRDEFRGRAGLSGTSVGFLGEGPLPGRKGSWLASVRRSYLDYLIKRIDPEAGFAFGFIDAQVKLTYDLNPQHQLSLTTLFGRALFEDGDPDIDANEIDTGTSRAWLTSLSWRYLPSPRFALTQRLYTTGLHYDNDNRNGATLDNARFAEISWRGDGSYSLPARAVVEFGGSIERLEGRSLLSRFVTQSAGPITLNDYDERSSAASGYGQVRMALGSRLSMTPGVRVDHWSLTGTTTGSPWINGEFRLDERTRLRGGTGIYRQFADFDQVHGIHGGGRDLRPERALHVDGGVERTLPHQTRLLVSVYMRDENAVMWTPGTEPRLSSTGSIQPGAFDAPWVNVLDGTARGAEVVVRRDSPDGFSGWAGYAYGQLKYTDASTGERFWGDADQRHTLTLYGNYRLSSRTSLSARYRYGSNYPMLGYIGQAPPGAVVPPIVDGQPLFYGLSGDRNTVRLPAYSRLDVRADRAFNWSGRRLVLFVDVANIVNHTNLRNTPYFVDRAGRVFGTTESLIPIVPSGGFVIEF